MLMIVRVKQSKKRKEATTGVIASLFSLCFSMVSKDQSMMATKVMCHCDLDDQQFDEEMRIAMATKRQRWKDTLVPLFHVSGVWMMQGFD